MRTVVTRGVLIQDVGVGSSWARMGVCLQYKSVWGHLGPLGGVSRDGRARGERTGDTCDEGTVFAGGRERYVLSLLSQTGVDVVPLPVCVILSFSTGDCRWSKGRPSLFNDLNLDPLSHVSGFVP